MRFFGLRKNRARKDSADGDERQRRLDRMENAARFDHADQVRFHSQVRSELDQIDRNVQGYSVEVRMNERAMKG